MKKRTSLNFYLNALEQMILVEFKRGHFQKVLGQLWWIIEPLFMSMLYYILTVVLFRYNGSKEHFIFIFFAVVIWRWFARSLENSSLSITSAGGILKQTNFSVLLVVIAPLVFEMINFFIALTVVLVITSLLGNIPSLTIIYLPILLLEQFLLILSFSLIFSLIGVYFRDIRPLITFVLGILFYLSPGIYPVSLIPEKYLFYFQLNPFYDLFVDYKNIFVNDTPPDVASHVINIGIYSITSLIALYVFRQYSKNIYKYL
jgi:lipopolysaccharide transport system permease protein